MSYDPYPYGSDEPPPDDGSTVPPAGDAAPRQRVQAPGIALIVVGVLNLLGTGWILLNVALMTATPANRLVEQQKEMYQSFPQMQAELAKKSPDEIKTQFMAIGWAWVVLGLLASALSVAGGIRMLSLKNYALSICGALAAVVPCVSATACCGIGEIIGIWALVVLINENVRAAFR
jgi:uncharacterized membrane protein